MANLITLDERNQFVNYKPDPISNYNKYENKKHTMKQKVIKHKKDIWRPPLDIELNEIPKFKSWFSILESKKQNVNFTDGIYHTLPQESVKYKSKEIILNLTRQQKLIVNTWLNAYLEMYNVTLKYIKDNINNDKYATNYIHVRSKLMDKKKEILAKFCNISTRKSKKTSVKVHDIDYAIKLACSNWKSAITNLSLGNIKFFRIRYWRKNKPIKIMDLEKNDFDNGSIRSSILGKVKGLYNGKKFSFNSIECDCRLKRVNDDYYLYVPEYIDLENEYVKHKKNKQITIDLGVRTFATCITENKVVKIGNNCGKRIKENLLRKDNIINNSKISEKIKKKNEKIINKKIKNLVREMHWKTINYLVKEYDTILVGDLSAKSIVSKRGRLSPMTKRISMNLSFYEFRQKLKYKCCLNKTKYGVIDEWMTSKMCSRCGEIKEELGGKKIYRCEKCKLIIDRDINGARNIHIKARK